MPSSHSPAAAPATGGNSSPLVDNLKPMNSRITELNESRTELLNRIQSLKQDVQNWRSKLDTQVNICRNELAELKISLNAEAEQLRSEFHNLRTNLQEQQDSVTASLKDLRLQDTSKESPVAFNREVEKFSGKGDGIAVNEEKKAEEDKAEESVEESEVEIRTSQANDDAENTNSLE